MPAYQIPDLAAEEFAEWQSLLERRTGLWLPQSRKAFLTTALSRHIRDREIADYSVLYRRLAQAEASALDWSALIEKLTVNETCFYREKNTLDLVANYCRNRTQQGFSQAPGQAQHLQMWSVGCSTGEEAFSLAIEMDKLNQGLKHSCGSNVYYGVTGIDISYPALAVARESIYPGRQLDFVPLATRNQYFNRLADDYWQVKDEIRQRTCFIQGNLLELDSQAGQMFDVIYCQNVLIYFKQDRKKQVVAKLATRLKPGGLMVLGHGEVADCPELTRVDNKHCLAFIREGN